MRSRALPLRWHLTIFGVLLVVAMLCLADEIGGCSDMVPGCDYVARAESEDELMQKAAQHAREAHGIQTLSADLVQQIKGKVRDE